MSNLPKIAQLKSLEGRDALLLRLVELSVTLNSTLDLDKLQKVFEEFYQIETPNTRRHGGFGIGLTITKGLIETQSGKIWAESEGEGKGSTFNVTFPLYK